MMEKIITLMHLDPPTMTSNYTYILSVPDGNANEVLSTDGSGTLSWSAGGAQNLFANIAVSGQNTVTADSPTDTLTLVAGSTLLLQLITVLIQLQLVHRRWWWCR